MKSFDEGRKQISRELPKQSRLHELFKYSPDNAAKPLIRLHDANNRFKAGSRAGSRSENGYYSIKMDGIIFPMGRIIMKYHGRRMDRSKVVDHIDGNPANNLIDNLQLITSAQNTQKGMLGKDMSNSTSQYRGVSWNKANEKWLVHISAEGIRRYMGSFSSEKMAAIAYDYAAKDLHGRFAVMNFPIEGVLL